MSYSDLDVSVYILEIWSHHPAYGEANPELAHQMLKETRPHPPDEHDTEREQQINRWRYRLLNVLRNEAYAERQAIESDQVASTLDRILESLDESDELYEVLGVLRTLHMATAYDEYNPTPAVTIELIKKVVMAENDNHLLKLK